MEKNKIMRVDFNEFLRVMTCVLIILLIIQGLDYITGIGINNYLFVLFCIAFAFTIGSIYHNILMDRESIEDGLDKEEFDGEDTDMDFEEEEVD